jgi:hypothetical protein
MTTDVLDVINIAFCIVQPEDKLPEGKGPEETFRVK